MACFKRRFLGLALVVLAALGGGPIAQAFTLNSQTVEVQGWRDRPLYVDYDFSGCPTLQAGVSLSDGLSQAIALWNSVIESSLRIEAGSAVTATVAGVKDRATPSNPVIICDPNLSATLGVDSNDTPGSTVNFRVDGSYAPITAAILLNAEAGKAANISKLTEVRLEVMLAHELGHVLGLGHSPDTTALMYYDITSKTRAALAQDDYDGIAYLYPRQEILNSGLMGCGIITISGQRPGGPGGGIELLILFLLCAAGWGLVRAPITR